MRTPSSRAPAAGPLPRGNRALALLAVLAAVVVAASGCVSAPPALEDDPEVKARGAEAKQVRVAGRPLTLAIVPVLGLHATEPPRNDPTRMPVELDVLAVTSTIRRDLGLAFEKVVDLRARVDAPDGGYAAFNEAAAANADVIAQVTFQELETDFRGRVWWIWPFNLAIWCYALVPAYFVPDMEFGARAVGTLELYSVASERPILEAPIALHGDYERMLNSFQRGFSLFGIFSTPWMLDRDEWRQVGERLNPHALYQVRRELVLGAADAAIELAKPENVDRDAATFALLVGVSRHQHGGSVLQAPPAARADVAAVRSLLESEGVPAKNILERLDDEPGREATLAGIVGAIEELERRARPGDSVLVYFSGCGTTLARSEMGEPTAAYDEEAAGLPALLPEDADPRHPTSTALPLATLLARLRDLGVRRAVVAIDAAFGRGPRAFERRVPEVSDAALASLTRDEGGKGEIILLAAAGPGGEAGDMPGAGLGYFTYTLVRGARGAANENDDADRTVTIEELAAYVRREMGIEASLAGLEVAPRLYRCGASVGAGHRGGRPAEKTASTGPWLTASPRRNPLTLKE